VNKLIITASLLGLLALQGCGKTEVPKDPKEHTEHAVAKKQMWHCPMHPNLIRDAPGKCPICGMTLVPFTPDDDSTSMEDSAKDTMSSMGSMSAEEHAAKQNGTIVKLDPAVIQTTGVTTEMVKMRKMGGGVHATGRVTADESRFASVPLRTMGYVEDLQADRRGMKVRKGQDLASIYSPDVVVAEEEFLRATGEFRDGARRRLLNWDVGEDFVQSLEKSAQVSKSFPVKSPIDGIVMEKMVVRGQTVMPGMEMFRILDLSHVWVMAQVPQGDLSRIQTGGQADVGVTGIPGKTFHGKVTWISPEMNMETRTAQVRVEVANTPGYDLRLDMFADVSFDAKGAQSEVLAVPQQALIPSGSRTIAIVSLGHGKFQPRDVQVGITTGGYAQILSGLKEGDEIVTSAQFLLDSESNLRAALNQMTGAAPAAHQHGN